MMRVSHATIGKIWSRRENGVVDFKRGRFFNFIFIYNCCILSFNFK